MNYLIKIFTLVVIIKSNFAIAKIKNNEILFNLNNKAYTNIDLERRIEYVEFINNSKFLNLSEPQENEILNDYVSSLIFLEYYNKKKFEFINLNLETNEFFKKNLDKLKINFEINNQKETYIKQNIRLDLIRKKIIENYINSNKNELLPNNEDLNLLYKFNISYIIFKKKYSDVLALRDINSKVKFVNFKNNLLNEVNKDSDIFFKEKEITDISKVSKTLKEMINKNLKIHYQLNNDYFTLISIEKNLISYEGIFVKLINLSSKKKIDDDKLNCSHIYSMTDEKKIIYKEYEYSKLNEQIKNNLKSINDYIVINDNNQYNYIFLCELKYDEKIINNINFNNKIQTLVKRIETNFVTNFKNEFNYKKKN